MADTMQKGFAIFGYDADYWRRRAVESGTMTEAEATAVFDPSRSTADWLRDTRRFQGLNDEHLQAAIDQQYEDRRVRLEQGLTSRPLPSSSASSASSAAVVASAGASKVVAWGVGLAALGGLVWWLRKRRA